MTMDPVRINLCGRRIVPAPLLIWWVCLAAAATGLADSVTDRLPLADEKLFKKESAALERLAQLGIERVVFCTRLAYNDPHWYANIGYFCDDENKKAYAGEGEPDESQLYLLETKTQRILILFDAKGGGIRDPHLHYDAKTVLFSYRPAGKDAYNLHEIQIDGTGLRQVTRGVYDDYEAAYLPDDDIVFVSTRSKRWVGCWMTQVGTLFRCDRNGRNIRPLSFNLEHDNTPAVLPDGRILYTRWEYVDRSQVGYHQLWTMNQDGSDVMAFFGNQQHYPLFIDARPIPDADEVLLIDSPGHGRSDHRGRICKITARFGPDDPRGYRQVTGEAAFNDPAPIDREHYLVAALRRVKNVWFKQIMLGAGNAYPIPVLTYGGQANLHEPIPVKPRPQERIVAERCDESQPSGRMILADVYNGRSMEGVRRGDVKKLLILEALPKPVNFSGGMDLTSHLGTFMLERVLGTVPVEGDGSAYFEVPPGRAVLFVALDANDMSVKRMQSFTNVMPGETLSCVGCHEHRTKTPASLASNSLMAVRRAPSRIKPFEGLPDVIDFRRHVQPILDAHCVKCHNYKDREGQVVLTDDLGICWSISYYTLLAKGQVADGRNGHGGQKPRTIGSCASALMRKIDGSHHDVTVSPQQWRTIWMWLESGAPYAGTYGALRNQHEQERQTAAGADYLAVLNRRCMSCHGVGGPAPRIPSDVTKEQREELRRRLGLAPHERIIREEDARFSAHVLLNLSRPQYSPLLLGPLPKDEGGWGSCSHRFRGPNDRDYQELLRALRQHKVAIDRVPRFGTPNFKPNRQYVREMKRFGILAAQFDLSRDPIDVFETDQEYWRLFWYDLENRNRWSFLDQ